MNILRKKLLNISWLNRRNIYNNKQFNFGILFDIDGVLIRGCNAVHGAKQMFSYIKKQILMNNLPFAMLTNSSESPEIKAKTLSDMFDMEIGVHQIINATAPLSLFSHLHDKRILFVGQGDLKKNAEKLGFKKPLEIADVQFAYPTLDVVDVKMKKKLKEGYTIHGMESIEALVLMGEPMDWQSYIQILIDLIVTNGNPSAAADFNCQQLPIYACNLDFLYTTECHISRFGNGAFLHCIEEVYKKYTGNKLRYKSIIGKPSEISFRYAEHVLSEISNKINNGSKIERIYMIGDNPSSDIMGANLYQEYLHSPSDLPEYRIIPPSINLLPKTVTDIKSILVNTGVYHQLSASCDRHQHWTFANIDSRHKIPSIIVGDCFDAFHRILEMEIILAEKENKS